MIGIAVAALVAASPGRQPYCMPGGVGIQIVSHDLRAVKVRGHWFASGQIGFHVICPPVAGELDLRIQEFRPHGDVWLTKGRAEKKDAAATVHGERFVMTRSWECSGHLSWRLRLFVSPGYSGGPQGGPTPPGIFFYPKRVGKQLKCEG